MAGKFPWGKIVSPKQTESKDGVPKLTPAALPPGAVKKP
jgi:hypothetical protein